MNKTRRPTLSAIASLLGGEGFSDHCAQMVKQYWLQRHVTPHSLKRIKQQKKAFGEIAAMKLSAGDRIVLGKFIGLISKASFNTGLRIGLMTLAAEVREDELDRITLGLLDNE